MPVFSSRKKSDEYYCKIYTADAELQFTIEATARGSTIFSLVCQTLGLREHWYFGLKYIDKASNEWNWLHLNRTILSQPIQISPQTSPLKPADSPHTADSFGPHLLRSPPMSPSTSTWSLPSSISSAALQSIKGTVELYLFIKFYPEDIDLELIQDITRRLFFLQVRQDILNMEIYCPPETAAHLASLSLQAKFGDYDQAMSPAETINFENEALLPLSCFQKVELSRTDWFTRIIALWKAHASLTREAAESAYLKLAQDLDMFGLAFFEISKMQGGSKSFSPHQSSSQSDQPLLAAELWLGIDSLGIRFYKKNKLRPEVFFPWSDIRSVTSHDKKIVLNLNGDKHATFAFYTAKSSISKEILDLATGNHELFMRRRREQPIEIQQMRYFEEQQKKEKMRIIARERELRVQAERRRDEIAREFLDYQQKMKELHETLPIYQEAAELLARKAHVSSEEARLQAAKALEIEAQLERCKYEMNRNEEEKRLYARQISECEQVISTLVNDSVKNRKEADELKLEVAKWRLAEGAAREKLLSITQLNQSLALSNATALAQARATAVTPPPYRPLTRVQESDERVQLIDKEAQLALQLQDLKHVIQSKKIEERQTSLDKAYEEGLAIGENKYSTIQKARSGTTSKRMAMLQDL